MTACSFIYKCKQRENMKKHPYFHYEFKRQATNWQGGVILVTYLQGRWWKSIIFNKNLIFLDTGNNYPLFLKNTAYNKH